MRELRGRLVVLGESERLRAAPAGLVTDRLSAVPAAGALRPQLGEDEPADVGQGLDRLIHLLHQSGRTLGRVHLELRRLGHFHHDHGGIADVVLPGKLEQGLGDIVGTARTEALPQLDRIGRLVEPARAQRQDVARLDLVPKE